MNKTFKRFYFGFINTLRAVLLYELYFVHVDIYVCMYIRVYVYIANLLDYVMHQYFLFSSSLANELCPLPFNLSLMLQYNVVFIIAYYVG